MESKSSSKSQRMEPAAQTTTSPTPQPPKPSRWGSAGWWIVVVFSVPFAVYASFFVSGQYHLYRRFTLTYIDGNHAEGGLNIRHHLQSWQTHAFAAIVFVIAAPFQFAANFRKRHHTIHRCIGYTFVASAIILGVSGVFFMLPHSEFRTWGKVVFVIAGVYLLACVAIAVFMAIRKNFKVHQRFMIRAAAIGYSYAAMRVFIPIFTATGMNFWTATDLGAWISPLVFVVVSEIYIQRALKPRQRLMEIQPKSESAARDIEANCTQSGSL